MGKRVVELVPRYLTRSLHETPQNGRKAAAADWRDSEGIQALQDVVAFPLDTMVQLGTIGVVGVRWCEETVPERMSGGRQGSELLHSPLAGGTVEDSTFLLVLFPTLTWLMGAVHDDWEHNKPPRVNPHVSPP